MVSGTNFKSHVALKGVWKLFSAWWGLTLGASAAGTAVLHRASLHSTSKDWRLTLLQVFFTFMVAVHHGGKHGCDLEYRPKASAGLEDAETTLTAKLPT